MSNYDKRNFSEMSEVEQSNIRLLIYMLSICAYSGFGIIALIILLIVGGK